MKAKAEYMIFRCCEPCQKSADDQADACRTLDGVVFKIGLAVLRRCRPPLYTGCHCWMEEAKSTDVTKAFEEAKAIRTAGDIL